MTANEKPSPDDIKGWIQQGLENYYNQRYFPAIEALRQADRAIVDLLPPPPGHSAPHLAAVAEPARLRDLITVAAAHRITPTRFGEISSAPVRNVSRSGPDAAHLDAIRAHPNAALLLPEVEAHLAQDVEEARVSPDLIHLASAQVVTGLENRVHASVLVPLDERLVATTLDFDPVQYYYVDIPMSLANSLVQAGHTFDAAIGLYGRVKSYPFLNNPIEAPALYLQMARAFLAQGDSFYRAGQTDKAQASYQQILVNGAVPAASPLYTDALSIMKVKVQIYLANGPTETPGSASFATANAILAVLHQVQHQQTQIANNLNFLGYPADGGYVPIFNFEYLQGIARTFAQFAAQANREYIAYTEHSDENRQNIRQLEQTVALNQKAAEIERSRAQEAQREVAAANVAESATRDRIQIARNALTRYQSIGWDIACLEEAQAWAGATSVNTDDQIKLSYSGLQNLGIQSNYQPQSVLIKQIAYQKATRSYELEVGTLSDNVSELNEMLLQAQSQTRVALARKQTADLSVVAAQWRTAYSQANLDAARGSEISAALYSEMAILVRETAQIYLQRAIEAAYLMQAAYNFERGTSVQLIRFDYGDIAVANGLFAADLLTRDIDYFTYDKLISARSKDQPVAKIYSLRNEFPLQFTEFRRSGKMRFQTILKDVQADFPGLCNARIKEIELMFEGATGIAGPIGRLTSGGVSKYRDSAGTIRRKVHGSECLLVSRYSPRKDALAADVPANQLRMFENFGLETDWLLDLPSRSNPFSSTSLTDVKLVISFLAQYDDALAAQDIQNLPANGMGEYNFSLRFDITSLWKTLADSGNVSFKVDTALVPQNQKNPRITDIAVYCTDPAGQVIALNAGFRSATIGAATDRYATSAQGVVRVESATTPGVFANEPLFNTYTWTLDPAQNPSLAGTAGTVLKLDRVYDIQFIFRYGFEY